MTLFHSTVLPLSLSQLQLSLTLVFKRNHIHLNGRSMKSVRFQKREISRLSITTDQFHCFQSFRKHKIIEFILPGLNHCQFGFLKNCSCLSQLLTFLMNIFTNIENKQPTYLDFKKAFDCVSHNELL